MVVIDRKFDRKILIMRLRIVIECPTEQAIFKAVSSSVFRAFTSVVYWKMCATMLSDFPLQARCNNVFPQLSTTVLLALRRHKISTAVSLPFMIATANGLWPLWFLLSTILYE